MAVLKILVRWLGQTQLPKLEGPAWDVIAEECLTHLARDSYPRSTGTTLVAALMWAVPVIGRRLAQRLPRASAALRGWALQEPGHSRPPIPRVVALALALRMARQREALAGLAVLVMLEGYLRPSEVLGLAACQFLPAQCSRAW